MEVQSAGNADLHRFELLEFYLRGYDQPSLLSRPVRLVCTDHTLLE